MKITVFTSNQPRHLVFIRKLAAIASEVYAIQECTTLFPGEVKDSIYNQSPLMKEYFDHVHAAEYSIFGDVSFLPPNVKTLSLKMGDIAQLTPDRLGNALDSNYIVVFGAGYIKPPLVDVLVEKKAVNIHMGVSPYFRGSSCNFWAVHDGHPELVGATIHLLSRGLDSGDMLFHALPKPRAMNPFLLGMRAVEAAQDALCDHIKRGSLYQIQAAPQDKAQEIRYSRYTDFNDEIVAAYLKQIPDAKQIGDLMQANQGKHALLRPVYA